jgi:putative ABC transport system ATP-binding protein
MITTHDLTKTYELGDIGVNALAGASLDVEDGEFIAMMGPSGSGKSTLMYILGCLDRQTSGGYLLDGLPVEELDDDDLAVLRNRYIGFVFQNYNLLPRLPAVNQVELPLLYSGAQYNRRERAIAALESVGLSDRLWHRPTEMSGGQQQRVGIARALVTNPRLILADEPTGNLDTRTSMEILDIFERLNKDQGITIILVTHEPMVAERARRVIMLRDGNIVSDREQRPAARKLAVAA